VGVIIAKLIPGMQFGDWVQVLDVLYVPNSIVLQLQKFDPDKRQSNENASKNEQHTPPAFDHRSAMELALHVRVERHMLLLSQRSHGGLQDAAGGFGLEWLIRDEITA
jgi:hypothetical protein